jgi:hypothetical protein
MPLRLDGCELRSAGKSVPAEETAMQTLIKVLGIIALIWIGFVVLGWVLGAVFELLFWALVIGAGVFIGSAAYAAVKGNSDRHALKQ